MLRAFFLPLLACLLLSGCRHLPDPKAFVDSTAALRTAVKSSGDATITELKRTKLAVAAEQAQLNAAREKLEREWQKRNDAMQALAAYAASLQEIAAAGKSSGESAKQLVASAQTLATSLGIANPAAGAVSLVSDTAQFIWSKLGEQKAAASLEDSLRAIDPAIRKMAALLVHDLDSLETVLVNTTDLQRGDLDRRHELQLSYYKQLRRNRDSLLAEMTARLEAIRRLGPAIVAGEAATPGSESANALARRDLAAAEIRKLDELLAATDKWRDSYTAEAAAIDEHERAAVEIIAGVRESFTAWADAHGDLLAAVQQKRLPTAAELKDSAERLRGLVKRYRDLRPPANVPADPTPSQT